MESHRLGSTTLTTTALGFGCASVFRLPSQRARSRLFHAAYDYGIRHFDTAPMYGMGRAEEEIAPLLRVHRSDITLTTKFGIDVTMVGRAVGHVQGPIRRVLAARPASNSSLQQSGAGPNSGFVGQILYSSSGYSPQRANASLESSLRRLKTDYIDIFALHDPPMSALKEAEREGIADWLDQQVVKGRIRSWAIANHENVSGERTALVERAPIIQEPANLLQPPTEMDDNSSIRITYGVLSAVLPRLRTALEERRPLASEIAGPTGTVEEVVTAALLREAVRRNPSGITLFSTTQMAHVERAVAAISRGSDASDENTLRLVAQAVGEK